MDITPEQVRQLVSLDVITANKDVLDEAEKSQLLQNIKPAQEIVLGMMSMVSTGSFKFGHKKEEAIIEDPYEIDIYAVTNRQYKAFLDANGYDTDKSWSKAGKKWKQEYKVTKPKYWTDKKWNKPDHPVVGVSYYEAEAFARWAGKQLPSEKQWERADRGTDGREFPWGNDFDKKKCNSVESGIGTTTRVTRYPNGISPSGCYDMAGNVWEWTSSWYDPSENYKILRGGSYYDTRRVASCYYSTWGAPSNIGKNIGFRCVRIHKK